MTTIRLTTDDTRHTTPDCIRRIATFAPRQECQASTATCSAVYQSGHPLQI